MIAPHFAAKKTSLGEVKANQLKVHKWQSWIKRKEVSVMGT
jgi:hypothetical protein